MKKTKSIQKIKRYFVIEQGWNGFRVVEITQKQAKTCDIKVFPSSKAAWNAISQIHIEPDH
jgi:hypothetical protein